MASPLGAIGCDAFESWDALRDDARALRAEAETCASADDECVALRIRDDCTGVLGCPFGVRAERQAHVLAEGTQIAERSQRTNTCSIPECPLTETAHCDVDSKRCVLGSRP